jgi:hypothetical protein
VAARAALDGSIVVSLDEVADAIKVTAERAHVIAEGAAGCAIAAARGAQAAARSWPSSRAATSIWPGSPRSWEFTNEPIRQPPSAPGTDLEARRTGHRLVVGLAPGARGVPAAGLPALADHRSQPRPHALDRCHLDARASCGGPEFLALYDRAIDGLDGARAARNTWWTRSVPHLAGQTIAYFSAEFALHQSLPIYAGGLGVLAGDH